MKRIIRYVQKSDGYTIEPVDGLGDLKAGDILWLENDDHEIGTVIGIPDARIGLIDIAVHDTSRE